MKNIIVSRTLFLIVSLFLCLPLVFANGCGVYAISAAVRSSDPICREIRDITLLSEKLNINLCAEYSEVSVKYVLWNGSDRDYTDIDYAFPMDYVVDERTLPEIKRVTFFCNDQQLDFAQSQDKELDKAVIKALPNQTWHPSLFEEKGVRRRWYYTKFSVKKHSFACLEVHYSLSNLTISDGVYPGNASFINEWGNKSLVYDLSPASCWGDGMIRDFYVEISYGDQSDIIQDVKAGGLDFERQNDKLIYHTCNFDLKTAKPLLIKYNATSYGQMERLIQNMLAPQDYSVYVSDEQSGYPRTNLIDLNLKTAWVGKIGSYIDFSFSEDYYLDGFLIVNGYRKSAEAYRNNSRVKKLKIEAQNEEGEFYVVDTLHFEDRPYQPVFFENLFVTADSYDLFECNLGYNKLRLTIEEVYPGLIYEDTCISEIIWLGRNIALSMGNKAN